MHADSITNSGRKFSANFFMHVEAMHVEAAVSEDISGKSGSESSNAQKCGNPHRCMYVENAVLQGNADRG